MVHGYVPRDELDLFFDYRDARHRAFRDALLALLRGRRNTLVPFDFVREYLGEGSESYLGIKIVPIDRIIGSEQRHRNFSYGFAPKKEVNRYRWTSIDHAMRSGLPLPPVMLFEVGGVYFVRDGNHRVSVAKSHGSLYIEAEVTRLSSRVHILPGAGEREIRRLISQVQEERFSKSTGLDVRQKELRPSAPGGWDVLIRNIERHRLLLTEAGRECEFRDAAASWFTELYAPMTSAIRESPFYPTMTRASMTDSFLRVTAWKEEAETLLRACFDPADAAARYGTLRRTRFAAKLLAWARAALPRIFRAGHLTV